MLNRLNKSFVIVMLVETTLREMCTHKVHLLGTVKKVNLTCRILSLTEVEHQYLNTLEM